MSYADYLRTKQINAPKVLDKRMNLGDASTYTWRTKLATTNIRHPTNHVITNQSDPFLVLVSKIIFCYNPFSIY